MRMNNWKTPSALTQPYTVSRDRTADVSERKRINPPNHTQVKGNSFVYHSSPRIIIRTKESGVTFGLASKNKRNTPDIQKSKEKAPNGDNDSLAAEFIVKSLAYRGKAGTAPRERRLEQTPRHLMKEYCTSQACTSASHTNYNRREPRSLDYYRER